MTPQAKKVLDYVKLNGETYIEYIGYRLDIPVSSIRRCIHEIYKDLRSPYYLETQNGIVRAYRG